MCGSCARDRGFTVGPDEWRQIAWMYTKACENGIRNVGVVYRPGCQTLQMIEREDSRDS